MRIHIDFELSPESKTLLESELRDHELTYSDKASASVLSSAPPDAKLLEADIAFGQPDPHMLLKAPHLKFVQISTSGITRYDTPEFRQAAKHKGLIVCNSAHVYNEACAEHVFSFLLAQSRNLPESLATREMGSPRKWVAFRNRCVSLRGQTLLIVGYGAIGERLVELLTPFQMRITAYRRHKRGDERIPVITTDLQLQHALAETDHVVNILPQHAQTNHFFDAKRFDQFKAGSVFHNIGRGSTVNQTHLLDALDSCRLQAAWLDVTDPEPLPGNHPLWLHPRVFLTPHVAGGHHRESVHLVQHFLTNFERFLSSTSFIDQIE